MNSKANKLLRKFRYSFEALIEQVRINVKFPCRISLSWNYGEGEAKTISAKPLVAGSAQFNDKLHFSVLITYEEDTKRYVEQKVQQGSIELLLLFWRVQSTLEITMITENGTSLAGFVSLDLANIVMKKENSKEVYEIERCPDKGAQVRMRIAYRYLSQAPAVNIANRVNNRLDEEELDAFDNRSFTPRSQYMPKTEYLKKPLITYRERQQATQAIHSQSKHQSPKGKDNNHINQYTYQNKEYGVAQYGTASQLNNVTLGSLPKGKEIIEKELTLLKTRATEFQNKFKNQRQEKQKLNNLMKQKEEVYFTLKSEVKRKELELEDLYKNLDEYKAEYETSRLAEEKLRKDYDRLEAALDNASRQHAEKISKLQIQASHIEKKYEKATHDLQKLRVQKQAALKAVKKELEDLKQEKDSQAEALKTSKREKEQLVRTHRLQKDNTDRTIRELSKQNKELQETINSLKEKIAALQKKVLRSQETRNEDLHKYSLKAMEAEKIKQALIVELDNSKAAWARKETSLTESLRQLEIRHTEEKNTAAKFKTLNTELQLQRTSLLKELQIEKQTTKSFEQSASKLQKQITIIRAQTTTLADQLQTKNSENKSLLGRLKEVSQELTKLQTKHEQTINEMTTEHSSKIKELKKAQQAKVIGLNKQLAKKTQEYEEITLREQKHTLHIEQLKEDLAKSEASIRERIDQHKKQEAQLKNELNQAHKKAQRREEVLTEKINALAKQLEQGDFTLRQYIDSIQRLNLKEQRLKEEVSALQNQLAEAMFYKQEADNKEMRVRQLQRKIEDAEEEIKLRETKQASLTKVLGELKEKLLEAETDRTKKENQIREKDKTIAMMGKQATVQSEERKKELQRREQEHKNTVDDLRQNLRRQKMACQELRGELEKTESNHESLKLSYDRLAEKLERLTNQSRAQKENQRFILEEKQALIKLREDSELAVREYVATNQLMEAAVASKDKEIKQVRSELTTLSNSHQQLAKTLQRNSVITEQIMEYCSKLQMLANSNSVNRERGSSNHSRTSTGLAEINSIMSEYDRLLQIRRTIVVVESRWRKETEMMLEREASQGKLREMEEKESEKLANDYNRVKGELAKLKKESEDLAFENGFIRSENEQLTAKLQQAESQIISSKSVCAQLEARLKEADKEVVRVEQETEKAQRQHETMMQEVRTQLMDKADKLKKELVANLRKVESRVEQLEQKNFTLELDNQKLVELPKREQEIRRLTTKMHETEKQLNAMVQEYQQKAVSLQSQLEQLQWEKKNSDEYAKSTIARLEKQVSSLQTDVESVNQKYKEQTKTTREKENACAKAEQTVQKLQHELSNMALQLQQEKDRLIQIDTRTRAQITKYKTENTTLKQNLETEKEKVYQAEEVKILKAALEEQLRAKEQQLSALSLKEESLSEQVFRLTQKLDQMKWSYQQRLESKDNEIMSIQEMIYSLNSKQNLRILKEQEIAERAHQIEAEKRHSSKQNYQYKSRIIQYEESIRMLLQDKKELEELVRSRRILRDSKFATLKEAEEQTEELAKDTDPETEELRKKLSLQENITQTAIAPRSGVDSMKEIGSPIVSATLQ